MNVCQGYSVLHKKYQICQALYEDASFIQVKCTKQPPKKIFIPDSKMDYICDICILIKKNRKKKTAYILLEKKNIMFCTLIYNFWEQENILILFCTKCH